jgi:hypothetical protein
VDLHSNSSTLISTVSLTTEQHIVLIFTSDLYNPNTAAIAAAAVCMGDCHTQHTRTVAGNKGIQLSVGSSHSQTVL